MLIQRNIKFLVAGGLILALAIAAYFIWFSVRIIEYPIPPRIESAAEFPSKPSYIVTSATAPIGTVRTKLEKALPTTLVTIDKRVEECVPSKDARLLGVKLFRTPRLGCNLAGEITRGAITLGGRGSELKASVPIDARIEIRDLGDIIKRETVTASADVDVTAKLSVAPDWSINSDIKLNYRWTNEPGIDIAGRRVTFTKIADAELAKSLGKIESELEAEIRKVDLRSEIAKAWADGHDTVSINRENPPVWLKITPSELGAGSLSVSKSNIAAQLMLRAGLELKVGDRPEPEKPGPLGTNKGITASKGFEVNVPVLADYAEVEPPLLKALRKLTAEELLGDDQTGVRATFKSVTLYATEEGRIAVGVEASIAPTGFFSSWAKAGGTLWLTGKPVTSAGSEVLQIEDLQIYGDMDRAAGDLLVTAFDRPEIRAIIEQELITDFANDYKKLVAKARKGLKSVKVGNARLSFDVDEFKHGSIAVTGEGLFMPVVATGQVAASVGN
ncbi:MAG: DUF4403 family protein [Pseudomonadota bacterium]